METKIVKLDRSKIDLGQIRKTARLVDDGGLAAFPTETVYGIACRVKDDSLAKLNGLKNREPQKHYTLHIAAKKEVEKYVPTIGPRVKKLIAKAWPGPVTIIFELEQKDMEKQQTRLNNEVFKNLYKQNSIGIRCPDDQIATILLASCQNPVVAPSANISGKPAPVNAEQVMEALSGQIDMVLDGGEARYKQSSTVVKIGKAGLEILRPGVYSEKQLEQFSVVRILFVCTGNTCRSPMAEGMFKKYLAEKLNCKVDQLVEKGYIISSAGTINMAGFPASPESIKACAAKGIDIRSHKSTVLSKQLAEESDYVFAMASMHCAQFSALSKEAADKCVLLAAGQNVPDPIGQEQRVYDRCAELIEKAVRQRLGEFVI